MTKYDKLSDHMESTYDERSLTGSYTFGIMHTDFEINECWYQDDRSKTGMWIPESIELLTNIDVNGKNIVIFDDKFTEDKMEAYLLFLIDKGLYTESDAECIEDTRQEDYFHSIRNGCIF